MNYVHGRGRTPSPIPEIHWWRVGTCLRPIARLNTAASRLCEEIVRPPYEIGVRVLCGVNEDEGGFALQIVPWRRGDLLSVLLQPRPRSFNTQFHAGALVAIQENGRSKLRREGNLLVGKLESARLGASTADRQTGKPPRAGAKLAGDNTELVERLSSTIDLLELVR